jgi:hypothetical protein
VLKVLREEGNEDSEFLANELEYLFDKGIVFQPDIVFPEISDLKCGDEFYSYMKVLAFQSIETLRHILQNELVQFPNLNIEKRNDFLEKINSTDFSEALDEALGTESRRIVKQIDPQRPSDFEDSINIMSEYFARGISLQLRELANMDASPLVTSQLHSSLEPMIDKSDLVQIVIGALPIPDDSVGWEQIFDYRSDPDSAGKFLALRNWMNEIARARLTQAEMEDKLEYLIDQYTRHLNVHKLKTNVGALETVVVAGAEFLEDFVKFKWGKIAKGLFSFKHRRIALMEGELKAPGNEIAYIVSARQRFSM